MNGLCLTGGAGAAEPSQQAKGNPEGGRGRRVWFPDNVRHLPRAGRRLQVFSVGHLHAQGVVRRLAQCEGPDAD